MSKAKNWPHWCREYPTLHAFKASKRRQVRELERALSAVHSGCAFMPIKDVGIVLNLVREWKQNVSVKAWGR